VKCTYLNWVAHSKGSSNLLSRTMIQGLDLREREELKLWILGRDYLFLSGQHYKGVGGGVFIAPTTNRVIGKRFTGLVR
jgi:ribose 5-phosphate isomerase